MAFYVAYRGVIQGPVDETLVVSWLDKRWIDEHAKIAPGPNGPWKSIQSHAAFEKALGSWVVQLSPEDEPTVRFIDDDATRFWLLTFPIIVSCTFLFGSYSKSTDWLVFAAMLQIISGIRFLVEINRSGLDLGLYIILSLFLGIGRMFYFAARQRAGSAIGVMHAIVTDGSSTAIYLLASMIAYENSRAAKYYYSHRTFNAADLLQMFTYAALGAALFVVPLALLAAHVMKVKIKVDDMPLPPIDAGIHILGKAIAVVSGLPMLSDVHEDGRTSVALVFSRQWILAVCCIICSVLGYDIVAVVLGIVTLWFVWLVHETRKASLHDTCRIFPSSASAFRRLFGWNNGRYLFGSVITMLILFAGLAWRVTQLMIETPDALD